MKLPGPRGLAAEADVKAVYSQNSQNSQKYFWKLVVTPRGQETRRAILGVTAPLRPRLPACEGAA